MATKNPRVTVRMYNVGFGDAFLVTIPRTPRPWRMLVDCGFHSSGPGRPMSEVIAAIVDEISDGGTVAPKLDVVVATHHHEDHIIGFADPAWDQVTVGEVWLSWVEDDRDPQARELKRDLNIAAQQVAALADLRLAAAGANPGEATASLLATAKALAANAMSNDTAIERLLGKTPGFVNPDDVHFLPHKTEDTTVVDIDVPGVRAHVMGPSRDEAMLKRMNPPKKAEWLVGIDALTATAPGGLPFDMRYQIDGKTLATDPRYEEVRSQPGKRSGLDSIAAESVLLGASKLERWCNNTSLFFVLEVGRKRLVFPGDAQQGAWEFVLRTPENLALLTNADFYKISHHGSHNGTPRRFVDEVLGNRRFTMLPYGKVEQWKKIPKGSLLEELALHHHQILRADAPVSKSKKVAIEKSKLWSEVTF